MRRRGARVKPHSCVRLPRQGCSGRRWVVVAVVVFVVVFVVVEVCGVHVAAPTEYIVFACVHPA